MAGRRNGHSIRRVDELFDEFLEHVKRNQKPNTYRLYKRYIGDFNGSIPNKRVHDLCPHDVQRWLNSKGWNTTTQKIAVGAIKTAFNWAIRQGLTQASPLAGMKKPPALSRDVLVMPDQWNALAASNQGRVAPGHPGLHAGDGKPAARGADHRGPARPRGPCAAAQGGQQGAEVQPRDLADPGGRSHRQAADAVAAGGESCFGTNGAGPGPPAG